MKRPENKAMPRPYGITDQELQQHGSVARAIDARIADDEAQSHRETYTHKTSWDWEIGSKQWGMVWAVCLRAEPKHERAGYRQWIVVAGLGGNMEGVIVAHKLPSESAARLFSDEFGRGSTICLTVCCAEQWEDYVNSAHAARAFDVDTVHALRNRARASGTVLAGKRMFTLDRSSILEIYRSGEGVEDAVNSISKEE